MTIVVNIYIFYSILLTTQWILAKSASSLRRLANIRKSDNCRRDVQITTIMSLGY